FLRSGCNAGQCACECAMGVVFRTVQATYLGSDIPRSGGGGAGEHHALVAFSCLPSRNTPVAYVAPSPPDTRPHRVRNRRCGVSDPVSTELRNPFTVPRGLHLLFLFYYTV